MKTIKVLVANRPRLMRELVLATISDQPDIEVVGVLDDEAGILESVERAKPDFLIVRLINLRNDRAYAMCCWTVFRTYAFWLWQRNATAAFLTGPTWIFVPIESRTPKKEF